MHAHDIANRCQMLADAGWHPTVVTLSWWQDRGWQLEISIHDNIEAGTPQSELPTVEGLPVPYEPRPSPPAGPVADHPGVTVGGWARAADYVEPLRVPEAWEEQAGAICAELRATCDGDRVDSGHEDNVGTPWARYGRHRWVRVRLWQWQTEQMRELRARAKKQRGER